MFTYLLHCRFVSGIPDDDDDDEVMLNVLIYQLT